MSEFEQAVPDLLTGLRSGAWLDEQVFPALRFVVPAIVPEGTTVIAGAPKVGKSWAVLHIALCVANGRRVFGCLPTGDARPVLYCALEDGFRRLQARSRTLLGDGGRIPDKLDLLIEVPHGQAVATIAQWLDRHRDEQGVVIVDTLGRVMPRSMQGESAYERDYRALSTFKRLGDDYPGTAMVLVHHTRKLGSEDFVDGVSGTLGITGAADTTVVLTRGRTEDGGLLRVTGRDIAEGEYAVEKADTGTWTLVGGSLAEAERAAGVVRATTGVSDRSAEIVALVSGSSDGIGPTEVAEKLGIEVKAAGTYLGRLVERGSIRKVGRGRYAAANSTNPHSPHAPGQSTARRRHLSPVEPVESVDFAGQSDDT